MSSEPAEFQARSAFTGVGFTTHESEDNLNITHEIELVEQEKLDAELEHERAESATM